MKSNSRAQWLASSRGQQFGRVERECMAGEVRHLYGRTLLQVGDWGPELIPLAPHFRRGILGPEGDVQVVCGLESLPVVSGATDALVLAHSLEFSPAPHQLLREADRALTARGQLLILAFNPFSHWGLRQRLLPWSTVLPPAAQLLSPWRLSDWLNLLDYEILSLQRYGSRGVVRGWPWALFQPGYLLHARKRRLPLNPVGKPAWRRPPADVGGARIPTA